MRFLYTRFENYIGFKAEMGLNALEIDFSKAKNRICLIVGQNGSGKSTLMTALNLFPDKSEMYIDGKTAKKILKLIDKFGSIYEIEIISEANGSKRKTTKAFIKINGEELNPNGNVSSYKEIIFNEFELDSNFLGLTLLTSTDRGLGDKRPAERKKYISSIIDNLVTYNNMFKTLNKKSLLYKSHINTLHTKIQTAGDKNALEASLKQLKDKEVEVQNSIMASNNKIVEIQTKVNFDAQDSKLLSDLNKEKEILESSMESEKNNIELLRNKLNKIRYHILEEVDNNDIDILINKYMDLYQDSVSKCTELETKISTKNDELNKLNTNIHKMEISTQKFVADEKIEESYKMSKFTLDGIKQKYDDMHLEEKSIDQLRQDIKEREEFKVLIEEFYNHNEEEDIQFLIHQYQNTNLEVLQTKINKINDRLKEIDEIKKATDLLQSLPKDCSHISCPFKERYVNIIAENHSDKDIVEEEKSLYDELELANHDLKKYYHVSQQYPYYVKMKTIHESQTSRVDFDYHLSRMKSFSGFTATFGLVNMMNIIKEYEDAKASYDKVKAMYDAYQMKKDAYEDTSVMINSMKKDAEKITKEISDATTRLDLDIKIKATNKDILQQLRNLKEVQRRHGDLYHKLNEVDKKIKDIENKIKDYKDAPNQIFELQKRISECQMVLKPIDDQISDINGRLTLLDSYYKEYNTYNNSYQFIEILKKYCSPTGGGIQTVFMQLYMSKTLEACNKILTMMFGGTYRLLDFVINENEFRIPFVGPSGLVVDDISSGSNSQICMFGMVINLVLLNQASTKYNIASLDEIDGGLDHKNRYEFISALYQSANILDIDQMFMISHSMEADMSQVDVIKLKTYSNYEDVMDVGNVIFDYSEL